MRDRERERELFLTRRICGRESWGMKAKQIWRVIQQAWALSFVRCGIFTFNIFIIYFFR
jgi:hypothetical protein